MAAYALGIDLGTQSVKAVLVEAATLIVCAHVTVPYAALPAWHGVVTGAPRCNLHVYTALTHADGVVFGEAGRVTTPVRLWVDAVDRLMSELVAQVPTLVPLVRSVGARAP